MTNLTWAAIYTCHAWALSGSGLGLPSSVLLNCCLKFLLCLWIWLVTVPDDHWAVNRTHPALLMCLVFCGAASCWRGHCLACAVPALAFQLAFKEQHHSCCWLAWFLMEPVSTQCSTPAVRSISPNVSNPAGMLALLRSWISNSSSVSHIDAFVQWHLKWTPSCSAFT